MNPIIGAKYYRPNHCGVVNVRQITAVVDNVVYFDNIFGPESKRKKSSFVSLKTFQNIARRANKDWILLPDDVDPESLCGVKIRKTVLCRGVNGDLIFRCSDKKANWYVTKRYAIKTEEGIQLIDDKTEKRLQELYGVLDNPYFFEVKNDKCPPTLLWSRRKHGPRHRHQSRTTGCRLLFSGVGEST